MDECSSSPCENGAICMDRVNGFNCTCVPGYTGTRCETDIDECSSSPCENGSTCTDRQNSYACDCGTGYNGTRCQIGEFL